jgi:ribonuclease Z
MQRIALILLMSLESAMKSPYFPPTELRSEVAQEWRRLIIKSMFPGTKARKMVDTKTK